MAKVLKWVALLLAGGALILVGVAFALQQWLRSDDFRGRVEREASAALGAPLQLGRLSIDLWPLPAVAADDVQLQTRPPLSVGRVEARPVWSGLLEKRLEIATLVVRKAVLPQAGIASLATVMQKKDRAAPKRVARPPQEQGPSLVAFPRRALLDDITWIDEKGQRLTMRAEADLGDDGMLERASFKILQGRFAGTQGSIERKGEQWPLRVDIGGGRIVGKLHLTAGSGHRSTESRPRRSGTPRAALACCSTRARKSSVRTQCWRATATPISRSTKAASTIAAHFRNLAMCPLWPGSAASPRRARPPLCG